MKSLKKLWYNHKGFSMLELFVALGIMMVILGVTSLSLAIQPATEAKKTTHSIDAMLTRTKVGSLAKSGDVYMEVYINSDNKIVLNYYEDDTLRESEVLTTRDVRIYYDLQSSTKEIELTSGDSLVFAFDRRTTGFLTLEDATNLTEGRSNMGGAKATGADYNDYCNKIWIGIGEDEKLYHIDIGPTTGTHYPSIK